MAGAPRRDVPVVASGLLQLVLVCTGALRALEHVTFVGPARRLERATTPTARSAAVAALNGGLLRCSTNEKGPKA